MANSSGRGQTTNGPFSPPRLSGRGYVGTAAAVRPAELQGPRGRAATPLLSIDDHLKLARAPKRNSPPDQGAQALVPPVLRGALPGPYEASRAGAEMVGDDLFEHPLGMSPPLDGLYQLNRPNPAVRQGDGAFGTYRRKRDGSAGWHHGLDLTAAIGTPVYSAQSGTVAAADGHDGGGYGDMVEVHGADGRGSRYAHLSKMWVKKGDKVSQGQLIGYTGVSGNPPKAGTPHLHFEVLEGRKSVNPDFYFDRKGLANGRPLNPYIQELIYGTG